MASPKRLVWYEGMTLDPHHFQQWERYQQGSLNLRVRALAYLDWGLTSVEVDTEAISNGLVRLKSCSGFMRDGTPFDMPGSDAIPTGRSVDKFFPATDEKLRVMLAIPIESADGRNCYLDGETQERQVRFIREYISVSDTNTGSNERQISVARKNFALLFGTEPQEEFITLPIIEIVRSADGRFALNAKFVPTCLSIGASENLAAITRRLLELLIAKANALSERRNQQPSGQIEFTTADIKIFWLLHTLNTFIPQLNYHSIKQQCHPEQLFMILLSLAGQLTTFSSDTDIHVRDFPQYDHTEPSPSFIQIDSIIRQLLETAITTNSFMVPLEMRSESIWVGKIVDVQLLRTAQFFLTTSGDLPERKVVDELPLKTKVASPESITALASAAVPGLPISFSARPPVGLPSRPGLQYFRLEKTGAFWDAINRSGAVAIFLPTEFKSLKLGLVAVKEPG